MFVHGTTYYHFANPLAELDENFAKMRDMGLNTVRVAEIWPGWEVLEPVPGTFEFGELDAYVGKAHDAGLNVVMGIGINNPPFWVFEEWPDVRCVDVSGKVATRRVQSANHDHPAYRKAMERFIEAHVSHYARMAGISAWQFGNEIRYGSDIVDNHCTRQRFRDWLREQFEDDLDELNRRWGVKYRAWESIYPYLSREGAPTMGLSPLAIATRRYQAWSLEELVAWGCEIVRRHSDLPVFHNNNNVSGASGSHWNISRSCDIVVQDIYPTVSPHPHIYSGFLLDCGASISRSQGKELWIGETTIGQYGTFTRDRVAQAMVETLVVEMIGCGARGVLYFRHKAPKYEQPHKFTGSQPVFRRDGSPLSYVKTPEHIRELMDRLGERILSCKPLQPLVGLYYPEESHRFAMDADYQTLQNDACFGASSLWNRLGYPVHILPTRELLEEDISALKVIYLPMSYLLPSSVGARLRQFVQNGGVLISEVRPGYIDDDGWLYEEQPGAGLVEVFGAREDLFWNGDTMAVTSALGDAGFPSVFQTFRLQDAAPLACNASGEVVAVEHNYGKGRAILMGFAPSLLFAAGGGKYEGTTGSNATSQDRSDALAFARALTEHVGLCPPTDLHLPHDEMGLRYLESERETLLFLMNYGASAPVTLPDGFEVIAVGSDSGVQWDARPLSELESNRWLIAAKERDNA